MNLLHKTHPGSAEWFEDAGDPAELISISRPVGEEVFGVRAGGYGLMFSLPGVDTECLSDDAVTAMSSELQTAQRLVPEDFITYQIARVKRRGIVPRLKYTNSANPIVAETEQAREVHLAKVGFRSVELFLTVYAAPPTGLRTPGARAQSTGELLTRLEQVAETLTVNMQRFGLKRLNVRSEICEVYGYIANLHGNHPLPSSDRLAEELAGESIRWNDDGIKVGSQHGKLFSLLRTPKKTHPNLFGELLRIDADMVLVLESQRRTADQTRAEASSQETFTNVFREKILTLAAYFGDAAAMASKPKSASSLAADKSINTLSGVLDDLDNGITYTQTSLIGLVHAPDKKELDTQMAHVHRVAGKSQAVFHTESIGVLSAFASLFPGAQMAGRSTNVRRRWLREDHLRNISLVHAPYIGEPWSKALENEAHSIFGTRDGTPFHYDPWTEGHVRGCFVFGETGRGKSFLLNHIVDHELKYGGYVFVFDLGGSYENTILKHGGKIVRFGLNGPRLNPFALPDTEENHRFVQRMVRMLLVKAGAIVLPTQERDINERIARLFSMERAVRRLKHLILPANLQPYLDKWIEGRGVYGNIFDNVEDELELSTAMAADFEPLGDGPEQQDLMEPLITWIRWRIAAYTRAASTLGVPKLELYEEAWRHMKDQQMLDMLLASNATGRKNRGGMMLATQSPLQLGDYIHLIRTNCPDCIFMGGSMNRKEYGVFGLNERQLELIESLAMGEFLLTRKKYSKVCRLSVDEQSRWLYSTDPNDRVRRNKAIEEFGREEAFRQLVAGATANEQLQKEAKHEKNDILPHFCGRNTVRR